MACLIMSPDEESPEPAEQPDEDEPGSEDAPGA
jgi:hypothetical protein